MTEGNRFTRQPKQGIGLFYENQAVNIHFDFILFDAIS